MIKPGTGFSKTQQRKHKQGSQNVQCIDCRFNADMSQGKNVAQRGAAEDRGEVGNKQTKSSLLDFKKKQSFNSGGLDDMCGLCLSRGRLLMQCPHCHAVRYCDQACMDQHWLEGHQFACKPAVDEDHDTQEFVGGDVGRGGGGGNGSAAAEAATA